MRIPERNGRPTVSATMLRTYGAGDLRLEDHEQEQGCPKRFKARYVDHDMPKQDSWPLRFGRMLHRVFQVMEDEQTGPEEALKQVFPATLGPDDYAEAVKILNRYLERSEPRDRFSTIATEVDLEALLYVDEEYGEVWLRGIIDKLDVDMEDPTVIHLVDIKSHQQPPKADQLTGDIQLLGYTWLIHQHWDRYMSTPVRRVVSHLDCIRYRDVAVKYSQADLDAWHAWTVAVVRRILRDQDASPRVNPGCPHCPLQSGCEAFLGLPSASQDFLNGRPDGADVDKLVAWRDDANQLRLMLDKSVKQVDRDLEERAIRYGGLEAGGYRWSVEEDWATSIDPARLHHMLGDDFYQVVNPVKSRVEKLVEDWQPSKQAQVMALFAKTFVGTKVVRRKRDG